MIKRNNHRVKAVLPVSVHCTDAAAGSRELAHTVDISHSGARLAGLRRQFQPGDVVDVQYRVKRARFRVVWSRMPAGSQQWQIGLECLERQKEIWGLSFSDAPIERQCMTQTSETSGKRRAHVRYPVQGGADVRRVSGGDGQWTQVAIISMGGCFCRTTAPLPLLTRVRIFLRFEGTEFEAYGVVRSVLPYRGMGIEFTGFVSSAESQRMKWFINSLQDAPLDLSGTGLLPGRA
jgi:hypothetical protein